MIGSVAVCVWLLFFLVLVCFFFILGACVFCFVCPNRSVVSERESGTFGTRTLGRFRSVRPRSNSFRWFGWVGLRWVGLGWVWLFFSLRVGGFFRKRKSKRKLGKTRFTSVSALDVPAIFNLFVLFVCLFF